MKIPVDVQVPGDDCGRLGRNPGDGGHLAGRPAMAAAEAVVIAATAVANGLAEILSTCWIKGCKKISREL